MRNNFHLLTPYKKYSEINCFHTVEIVLSQKYNITGLLLIKQNETILEVNYVCFHQVHINNSICNIDITKYFHRIQ